jgi:hypothetical protein
VTVVFIVVLLYWESPLFTAFIPQEPAEMTVAVAPSTVQTDGVFDEKETTPVPDPPETESAIVGAGLA